MFSIRNRSRHTSPSFQPQFEAVETRLLLSGPGTSFRPGGGMVAMAARRSLSLRGVLSGTVIPTTTDGVNYLVTVTLQGYSGNPRLGNITVTASATTTAADLSRIGRSNLNFGGLPVQISSSSGDGVALGTLRLNRSRSAARVPFQLTANLGGGTGVLAGASGRFTLQGNFNALLGSQLNAQLRGNLRTLG